MTDLSLKSTLTHEPPNSIFSPLPPFLLLLPCPPSLPPSLDQGIFASLASQPGDVILSRVNRDRSHKVGSSREGGGGEGGWEGGREARREGG